MQTGVGDIQRGPGSLLLHPAPLVALVVLVLNDHVLKAVWPGVVTGKLSDLAGAFLFPVLVLSIGELALSMRRPHLASPQVVTTICVLTAMGLILVKTVPAASTAYGALAGLVRWPFLSSFRRVQVATDPTDLVALTSVGLAWVYTGARSHGTSSSPVTEPHQEPLPASRRPGPFSSIEIQEAQRMAPQHPRRTHP